VAGAVRIAPDIYSQFAKDDSDCTGSAGSGSGMCLRLATNHEPVFPSKPREGVQFMSQGVLTPAGNYASAGALPVPDPADKTKRHVECVDCHNPHQVNNPRLEPTRGGRFKGMKGIGIDTAGNQPVIVGECETTAYGSFDATHCGNAGQGTDRDPYVYEICFRCHGNSVTNVFGSPNRHPDDLSTVAMPAGFTSFATTPFPVRTDPQAYGQATGADAPLSFKGFSNKWREFNPFTDDIETPAMIAADLARFAQLIPSHTQQTKNPAYHPVAAPGRNGSLQLCNQLKFAFNLSCASPGTELANLTIQCTDCHNNDHYDAFNNAYTTGAVPTPLKLGPLTESNLRPTDKDPFSMGRYVSLAGNYNVVRVNEPIGPHGSARRRLLRANYDTDVMLSTRCFEQGNPVGGCARGDGFTGTGGHQGGGSGTNTTTFTKFLLCFQCHDRAAFDPAINSRYDGVGTTAATDRSLTRFFGITSSSGVDSWWEGNLHMYHLRWTGAMCHECHYNVHSNIEAVNTVYGDGKGGSLAADAIDGITDGVVGTHLINFSPMTEGTVGQKPTWFYDGTAFRCYLRCHNEVMNSCAYQAPGSGTPNARWCAGGRNPGTAG
jgi:hypothetical protein